MKVLVERHDLKEGDKFVIIGSKNHSQYIDGMYFKGGELHTVVYLKSSTNIKFNGGTCNINLRGDSGDPRIRLPYKNELKRV